MDFVAISVLLQPMARDNATCVWRATRITARGCLQKGADTESRSRTAPSISSHRAMRFGLASLRSISQFRRRSIAREQRMALVKMISQTMQQCSPRRWSAVIARDQVAQGIFRGGLQNWPLLRLWLLFVPQPRDPAAPNSLRCSLAVLLSLRGLSSIAVSRCTWTDVAMVLPFFVPSGPPRTSSTGASRT